MNNLEVRKINLLEASNFCGQNDFDLDLALRKGIRPFGLFESSSEKLFGICVVCNPTEKELQSSHTSELTHLYYKERASSCSEVEVLRTFVHGILGFNLWDLRVGMEVSKRVPDSILKGYFSKCETGYEWFNSDFSFYVYRITSSRSDRYYLGRRSLRISNATVSDCQKDPYFGSGGKRLQEWKNEVGKESLRKEVLSIHSKWRDSVSAEKEVIGDRHLKDPLCLNYQPGGLGLGRPITVITSGFCEVHGETKFHGKNCSKCTVRKVFQEGYCELHGETVFRGENCAKCVVEKIFLPGFCEIHGNTKFRVDSCVKCENQKAITEKVCRFHGFTKHLGNTCATCTSRKSISLQFCSIHGETKFQGDNCSACRSENSVTLLNCPIHGRTKHRGQSCSSCSTESQFSLSNCSTHGYVIHKGGTCASCTVEKAKSIKTCEIHGETNFQGNVCGKCNSEKSVSLKNCPKHGFVKHQGDFCSTCNSRDRVEERRCEIHGLTKFQGGTCSRCRNKSLITVNVCKIHGETKFRGGRSCCSCSAEKANKSKRLRKLGSYGPEKP